MRKTILFCVAAIFLMTSVCSAAKVDPAKIIVPRDDGRIVEAYTSPKADAPLIVYVQDIHMNYEAQKAEAAVLDALMKEYGFDLVLLEGKPTGSAKDFKELKTKYPKEARLQGAESLLKKGTISAVNYLDLTTDYDFTINGIEDMELYKKEGTDLMAIFEKSSNIEKLVAALKNVASNLKLHVYTKEMRDLDEKVAAYDKDEIGLVEYVKFLEGQASANGIDIKAMPNLSLFAESANLEGQINFPAVETERKTVMDAVEKTLTDKAKEEFASQNLKFRTGDITQGEFYAYLKNAAQDAKVDLAPHKNLAAYTQYITTYEKIDTTILFKEVDQLVNKIQEAMMKTPEQKKLSQIDKGLSILSGFVNTKLVPDEYNFYRQHKADFDLKDWLAFLKNNSTKFNLTNPVPDDIAVLEANMPMLEKFYSAAFDRDNAFISNMKANMTKLGKDKAIFVAGGFHTPNMKKLLKDNGFSYVIVAPRVDIIKDYTDIYKTRAKSDLNFLNNPAAVGKAVVPAPAANFNVLDQAEQGIITIDAAIAQAMQQVQGQLPEDVFAQRRQALEGAMRDRIIAGQRGETAEKAAADEAIRGLLQTTHQIGNRMDITSTALSPDENSVLLNGTYRMPGETQTVPVNNFAVPVQQKLTEADEILPPALLARLCRRADGSMNTELRTALERAAADIAGRGGLLVTEANPYAIAWEGETVAIPAAMDWNPVFRIHETLEGLLRIFVEQDGMTHEAARTELFRLLGVDANTATIVDSQLNRQTGALETVTRNFAQLAAAEGIAGNEDALNHCAIRLGTRNFQAQIRHPLRTGETVTIAQLDQEASRDITAALLAQDGLAGRWHKDDALKNQVLNVACVEGMEGQLRNNPLVQRAIAAGLDPNNIHVQVFANPQDMVGWITAQERTGQINLAIVAPGWNVTDAQTQVLHNNRIAIVRSGPFAQAAQPRPDGVPVSLEQVNTAEAADLLGALLNIHYAYAETDEAARNRCYYSAASLIAQMSGTDISAVLPLLQQQNVGALLAIIVLPPAASIAAEQAQQIIMSAAFAVSA